MPAARDWAYFDHAAVAPLSGPAEAILVEWAHDVAQHGDAYWSRWSDHLTETRRLGAQLINADPAEIALVRNTTEGINFVAEGFPWRDGDNVVTLADEFPSNLFPWMNLQSRGVETRRVPIDQGRVDLDRLEAACDQRTRIITLSWVGYASGWRNDLDAVAEIARRRGAYFFLDAIQGLGVFPLDVQRTRIDFLAADGHKWLLGPEGAGYFFLRREHLDLLRPVGIGWNSVAHAGDYSRTDLVLKNTAARYEGGTYNMGGLAALGESTALLLGYGVERIAERLLAITDLACQRLAAIGATIVSCREGDRSSGIVSFDLPGIDLSSVRRHCLSHGVTLSVRGGRLRISPHAYTTEADVDRLVDALTEQSRRTV
ncbi:MAG: aminotransferase class V-fold PLP-dependent enzyme [Planctomycetes bacterium]|nr:aminotransferase class V-fold PLP-dependent enzyme [Planctomycetota bacterium]